MSTDLQQTSAFLAIHIQFYDIYNKHILSRQEKEAPTTQEP